MKAKKEIILTTSGGIKLHANKEDGGWSLSIFYGDYIPPVMFKEFIKTVSELEVLTLEIDVINQHHNKGVNQHD